MSIVHDGIYGVIIGDMLGVPVEFERREALVDNPVTGPRAGGPYEQPIGSWSDDGALTLALADALKDGYNLTTIAQNHINWWVHKKYTSHDVVFDIGRQTRMALNDVLKILDSGDTEALEYLHFEANENTNGNGSLMRILPLYFYLKDKGIENNFEVIWQVSALTHPHIRSAIACLIYLIMTDELTHDGSTPCSAYSAMKARMHAFFDANDEAKNEAGHFSRLLNEDISQFPETDIRSGGYVIETLEASLWCLCTTNSYQEAVLKAVNLGDDTDTTGAVTGGLAGILYGKDTILTEWITVLPKQSEINRICDDLEKMLAANNI
jgi:ADP-ribosylglycohydrolase